jgi:hypothetical protein
MDVVALKFPTVFKMADFILDNKITDVETDSRKVTLVGDLDENLVSLACEAYEASLTMVPFKPTRS